MSNLSAAIDDVCARIARFRGSRKLNEQNTKATLLDPILRALGWNLEDLDEVQREYKVKRRDRPVDYALLLVRTPRLFIEAKALNQDLNDRRWSNQIMGYAAVAGVDWVVLTNGDEFRLYNAHAAVAVDDKLFRSFKLTDDTSLAKETLGLLGRERMQENRLETLWRTHFVDRQVMAALEELFDLESEPSLARLLRRRLSALSPADIKASLRRAHVAVTFPTEAVSEQLSDTGTAGRRARQHKKPATHPLRKIDGGPRKRAFIGVSVKDLIQAGTLIPPLRLTRVYKGVELSARIDKKGAVWFDGERTESLSSAADRARAKVLDSRSERKGVINTNGWTFWKFMDDAGELQPVDVLRKRYLENRRHGTGSA